MRLAGISVLTLPISEVAQESIIKALQLLDNGGVAAGLKIMGTLIGSSNFADERFSKVTDTMQKDTNTVFSKMPDPQIASQLY
eukprot:3310737-Ditylum_brightwellii.AAC.1